MRIIESNFSELILSSKKINLGEIYFFNDLAVVELNEGVHIDSSNSYKIFEELNNYFGNSKPFGLFANRFLLFE